jgi:hypothetical protein
MDKDFYKRIFKISGVILVVIFLNSTYAKTLFFNYEDLKPFDFSMKQLVYVFIISVLITSFVVFWFTREKDIVIRIVKSFSYSIFVAMALTVLVDVLDNSFVFHVNRMYTQKKEVIGYRVTDIKEVEGLQTVTLRLNDNKSGFNVFNKFSPEDAMRLTERNILFLETGIGLFDRPFLYRGTLEPRKIY